MKFFKKKQIFFIVISIFLFPFQSLYSSDDSIQTASNWHISKSTSLSLKNVLTKGEWKPISNAAQMQLRDAKKDSAYIWLRGDIFISGDPSFYYGISPGRIEHLYTLYLNNRKIDSLSVNDIDNMFSNRHYLLRKSDLKLGKNHIYIRLGIFRNYIGGIPDGVSIMKKEEFKKSRLFYNFRYIIIPYCINFFFLLVTIVFFFILLFSKEKILFVLAILLNVFAFAYIFLLFTPYSIISHDLSYTIVLASYPISILLFFFIYQALYRVYLLKQNMIIAPIFILISLTLMMLQSKILLLILILSFSGFQICTIFYLNSIKKDNFKLNSLLIHVGLNTLLYLSAGLIGPMGSRYTNLVFTYAFPIGFVIIPYLILRDYKARWLEMEFLYDELKRPKRYNAEVPITDSSEKKLELIIDFIKKNYASDISREGLAEAVDVSPNYMSSLFNQYMNMRIDEYINKLRVEDAAKHLEQGNTRIIDVAFSVGFESLPTFNRAFKKIYGISPSEYRDNNSNK
ncbi:MAG: helix-turn-helix transcriptional regulator [bacterium]|nr:helix-turn-helix transcriptional regulator [bacterium]